MARGAQQSAQLDVDESEVLASTQVLTVIGTQEPALLLMLPCRYGFPRLPEDQLAVQ